MVVGAVSDSTDLQGGNVVLGKKNNLRQLVITEREKRRDPISLIKKTSFVNVTQHGWFLRSAKLSCPFPF